MIFGFFARGYLYGDEAKVIWRTAPLLPTTAGVQSPHLCGFVFQVL
jgi:hypothetical protein